MSVTDSAETGMSTGWARSTRRKTMPVSGAAGNNAAVHVYKGIPYAAPPVGALAQGAAELVVVRRLAAGHHARRAGFREGRHVGELRHARLRHHRDRAHNRRRQEYRRMKPLCTFEHAFRVAVAEADDDQKRACCTFAQRVTELMYGADVVRRAPNGLWNLHAETGEAMSDAQLRDEVMTLLIAGHETTANALSWMWVLLDRGDAAIGQTTC